MSIKGGFFTKPEKRKNAHKTKKSVLSSPFGLVVHCLITRLVVSSVAVFSVLCSVYSFRVLRTNTLLHLFVLSQFFQLARLPLFFSFPSVFSPSTSVQLTIYSFLTLSHLLLFFFLNRNHAFSYILTTKNG